MESRANGLRLKSHLSSVHSPSLQRLFVRLRGKPVNKFAIDHNEWDTRVSVNFLLPLCRCSISLNIVLNERDTTRLEEFTRFSTVTTPSCGKHFNACFGNSWSLLFLRRNLLQRAFHRLRLLLLYRSHLSFRCRSSYHR